MRSKISLTNEFKIAIALSKPVAMCLKVSLTNEFKIAIVLSESVAMRSKTSLTNEFKIVIALLEIPVSGCTCFSACICIKVQFKDS